MIKPKILIVDDEPKSQEKLQYLIESHFPEFQISAIASSVQEAKEMINLEEPDLVYLDIMMPGLDGFSLIESYPNRKFEVIVTTASPEFGIQSVKSGAIDYILKPATLEDVNSSLRSYEEKYSSNNGTKLYWENRRKIAITTSNGFVIEDVENIIQLEADNNYTKVQLHEKPALLVSKPLRDFEKCLEGYNFFVRIHKSHIINMHFLKSFSYSDGGIITMVDGSTHPVSKRKNPEFFKALASFSLMVKS